ncbi:hypothetical protein WA026_013501 [Henosepilachna vigintioctopunctata]|uniref:GH18 domain-containing protein n=1 Tax=Henosepilachna vigintioctopunctata TaxID=420089 RepID=A0AAW1VFX6_9CUCU
MSNHLQSKCSDIDMILRVIVSFQVLLLVSREVLTANNVNCYYASWAAYRPGNGRITSRDIPANLCTHIFYAFLGLNDDGSLAIEDNDLDIVKGNFKGLSDLKKVNPNLKTLFSVGGANANILVFENIAEDPKKRKTLAESTIALCKEYNYDGIDIDWEYPQKKDTFVDLLRDLKTALEPHELLLTAAVDQLPINAAYDVVEMTKYLDIINVMSYDFHSPYWQTGQNSPLYFSPKESEWQRDNLNANSSITHWIEYGAQPEKITIGCGFYGKAMILKDPNDHGLMAPVETANSPGPYTNNIGTLGYNELCDFHMKDSTVVWDDDQQVPIMYKDKLWVGYDNERSVALKAQYAVDHGLFGIMMWSVETDDSHGSCGNGEWPLLKSINKIMKSNIANSQ